jgi:hypothetical protein
MGARGYLTWETLNKKDKDEIDKLDWSVGMRILFPGILRGNCFAASIRA